ncbi:4-hydroxybenzoate octaprenyltransferase [Candidatus Pelagibacter bacterium]|jgi:4-hydroxybenzoate polyprenyl transferase|nr:4-hydroxybenzoate octaprenyltransferase [Candidatus Pelagibacter bacterium]
MPNQINLFIDLIRLKKPIGFMLLFWPCAWGLTIAYDFNQNLEKYFLFLLLFLIGAILMRSAGCIINDIVDSDFDKKVERTKNRPIASGKISKIKAFIYAMVLCGFAFLVLIQFNNFTILMALLSMPMAFTYPLMKRFTYWPQLFLGITFNYGLVLAWISITNEISIVPILFYFGAIFWTLGYDTIYGFQDIKDDEIIGVKSASIKFKNEPKKILFFSYFIFLTSLFLVGILMNFKMQYYLFLSVPSIYLILQIKKLDISLPKVCLKIFKSNNFLGLLILINILVGKLI